MHLNTNKQDNCRIAHTTEKQIISVLSIVMYMDLRCRQKSEHTIMVPIWYSYMSASFFLQTPTSAWQYANAYRNLHFIDWVFFLKIWCWEISTKRLILYKMAIEYLQDVISYMCSYILIVPFFASFLSLYHGLFKGLICTTQQQI